MNTPSVARATKVVVLVGTVALIALFGADVYSFGSIGGEYVAWGGEMEEVDMYPWQVWATAGLILLLVFAAAAAVGGRIRSARRLFQTELALFVALNAFYAYRDGPEVRGYIGYEGSPVLLQAMVAGLVLRLALQYWLHRGEVDRIRTPSPGA